MPLDKRVWESSGETLKSFDLDNDNSLNFHEFKNLCEQLFEDDASKDNEYRIRDIFATLDIDGDGFLKEEEWEHCHKKWITPIVSPVNVLLVIDVQNDFIDGTLSLKKYGKHGDGAEVVEPINRVIRSAPWAKVVYSLDWHPHNHISFYENLHLRKLDQSSKVSKEEAKLFDDVVFENNGIEQKLWPAHCVVNTWGSELHKDLLVPSDSIKVCKGVNSEMDSYSAFFDNEAKSSTELPNVLKCLGATDLYVCGLAYDVCVKATCLDGLKLGFKVALIEDCAVGVLPESVAEARKSIADNGGLIVTSNQVPDLVNGAKRSLAMAQQAARALSKGQQKT